LTRAEATDSLEVKLSIDDFLDPDAALEGVTVELFVLPDTTPVPGTPRLVRADHYEKEKQARAALAKPDSAPPDTSGAIRPPPPRQMQRPQEPATPRDTVTLPIRDLVLVPAVPLVAGRKYLLRLEGLTNVSGMSGGGGAVEFEVLTTPPSPFRRDTTRLSAARQYEGASGMRAAPPRRRALYRGGGP
jgi:hypothetical protein